MVQGLSEGGRGDGGQRGGGMANMASSRSRLRLAANTAWPRSIPVRAVVPGQRMLNSKSVIPRVYLWMIWKGTPLHVGATCALPPASLTRVHALVRFRLAVSKTRRPPCFLSLSVRPPTVRDLCDFHEATTSSCHPDILRRIWQLSFVVFVVPNNDIK